MLLTLSDGNVINVQHLTLMYAEESPNTLERIKSHYVVFENGHHLPITEKDFKSIRSRFSKE